jgi:hypothetical protein
VKLSKSLYTRGLQCTKSLWLKKYTPTVLTPPDAVAKAIFERGNEVGDLACKLFPDGVEVEFNSKDYDGMINTTQKLMQDGVKNIYEASFDYDGIFVAVDILHINDDGSVEIHEVKSSTEVKDVYLHDVSIQYYVLTGLGYEVKKASVVYINNQYVRQDALDITKFLKIENVTQTIESMQSDIPTYLNHFRLYLENRENEPNMDIGKQCSDPYECDAMNYCWKIQRGIPDYSIFNISRLSADKKFDLYRHGVLEFNDIPTHYNFSKSQLVQIEAEKAQRTIINKAKIKEFIEGLSYPLYHLDFETFQQAIPQWKGISPFMQIPFQYSIHVEDENGILEHKEFLAEDGKDPRYELAKRLVKDIPTDVTVLAYNMGFEKGVIGKLSEQFEDLSVHLMAIHNNIQDLMTPFAKKDYYTPAMKGSYSIKYVLPALVPEMEKAYKELNLVHNGGEAMQTFGNLSRMGEELKQEYRKALLDYCKLDTLAMVKVLEKLKESVR